jgi:hypothetical protein
MRSMRNARASFALLVAALGVAGSGCTSCLSIDEYTLVPGPPPDNSTSSSSSSGAGGAPVDCTATSTSGRIMVSAVVPGGNNRAGEPRSVCGAVGADFVEGTLELFALDPERGDCVARAGIIPSAGAQLESLPRIQHATDDRLFVAATFRGGGLQLPLACDTQAPMSIDLPAGATDALLVAKLRLDETSSANLCTEWARIASTSEPGAAGALRVRAVRSDDEGRVAIVGTLGGALTAFDGSAAEVRGEAFFARYLPGGALGALALLDGDGTPGPSIAMGVAIHEGSFLVTGGTRLEQPACEGCAGKSNVVDAAAACAGDGGSGGNGGAGGAGGAAGGGGGGGGGAAFDAVNALLWIPPGISDDTCPQLTTYGADGSDEDVQIGFDLSRSDSIGACSAFWTGLAGRAPWPIDVNAPSTTLFDSGGSSLDGFLVRLDGGEALGCGSGAPAWSSRLVPTTPGTAVWGERVAAERCGQGATVAVAVRGDFGPLQLHHCTAAGECVEPNQALTLADAERQAVILGMTPDGAAQWHGAFGPIAADADAGAGDFTGRAHLDLATDTRDMAYAVFEATGALALQNVEPFGCAALDEAQDLGPGVWVVALQHGGFTDRAHCSWALHWGP